MSLIATIAQEIINLYKIWERYKEDNTHNGNGPGSGSGSVHTPVGSPFAGSQSSASVGMKRLAPGAGGRSGHTSLAGTPREDTMDGGGSGESGNVVTPAILTGLLVRMREGKLADMARQTTGVGRLLERTLQAS
jgi:cyclin-C